MIRLNHALLLGSLGLVFVAGCRSRGTIKDPTDVPDEGKESAIATFKAKADSPAGGTVTFTEEGNHVRLVVEVNGVPPGSHAIHVHEKGDCSAPDFSSAGDHWNPTGKPHACPPSGMRHAGDLGNIEVSEDGHARMEATLDGVNLGSGPTSLLGKAVILHEGTDDCKSQPSGEAGGRLACAAIEPR